MPGTVKHQRAENLSDALAGGDFDAADYLNEVLIADASSNSSRRYIQESSSELQSLLAKLSAHNITASDELTQITDDILRSGSRLAYQVEILRGDANGLYDLIDNGLKSDIELFTGQNTVHTEVEDDSQGLSRLSDPARSSPVAEPDFMIQVKTLGSVKQNLEKVIHVFGTAMEWPMPSSEMSMASSFISVSAPEPGPEDSSRDEKAREVIKRLRAEVSALLETNISAAEDRIEQLRALAGVWKGTVEEKPRNKVIESLSKQVEDKKKVTAVRIDPVAQQLSSVPLKIPQSQTSGTSGLLRNLQRLRDEIYLD